MILQLVCSFIERAFLAAPTYTHLAIELGYLFILQDQVKEAAVWYSEAMKVDENSVAALTGLCRLGRVGRWKGRCWQPIRVAFLGPKERRGGALSPEGV